MSNTAVLHDAVPEKSPMLLRPAGNEQSVRDDRDGFVDLVLLDWIDSTLGLAVRHRSGQVGTADPCSNTNPTRILQSSLAELLSQKLEPLHALGFCFARDLEHRLREEQCEKRQPQTRQRASAAISFQRSFLSRVAGCLKIVDADPLQQLQAASPSLLPPLECFLERLLLLRGPVHVLKKFNRGEGERERERERENFCQYL